MAVDGGGVAPAADDMDGMQCSVHPYRSTSPGGICAFCLQEKLGKLVSASSSSSFIPSSSPSFRSELPTLRLTPDNSLPPDVTNNGALRHRDRQRRSRIPAFMLTQKKSKADIVLKRSKSTATPRSSRFLHSGNGDLSPRRRGFWSFLHKKSEKTVILPPPPPSETTTTTTTAPVVVVVVDEADSSPNSSGGSNTASFGRKVSRSRSVGCGSRSFSGDFFDRISTGFGDCTLRRVESHREGRRSTSAARAAGEAIKGRVPCGGLFSGFMITSSSSSSSWASGEDHHRAATPGPNPMLNGRNRNWAWAFASPRRAFATKTSMILKDAVSNNNNTTTTTTTGPPNLASIPSLLAVRGCAIVGE